MVDLGRIGLEWEFVSLLASANLHCRNHCHVVGPGIRPESIQLVLVLLLAIEHFDHSLWALERDLHRSHYASWDIRCNADTPDCMHLALVHSLAIALDPSAQACGRTDVTVELRLDLAAIVGDTGRQPLP